MLFGVNTVVNVGAGALFTVRVPETAGLLPTAVVRTLDVLVAAPTVTDVTGTVIVQDAPAAMLAPLSEMPVPPAAAENAPPHELAAAGVVAIVADVGTLSVNEMPETAAVPAALLMV
jgi:hypothetical protein